MNALGLADDPHWQRLASELNVCLLTAHFRDSGSGKSWHQAEAGSGQALLDALKDLSRKSGIHGLDKLPIAFAGLSTGGQYGYHWACWKPEQTLCFITLKGGKHNESFQPQILKTPGLWITAEQDQDFRQKNIKAVYDKHKAKGAPWSYVSEPKAGHESENASRLIAPYLKAILLSSKPSSFAKATADRQIPHQGGCSTISKEDFSKLLRDFEKGKSLETWPQLPLNSQPLPDYAMASPATLDFGNCESGQDSSTLEIQVSAHEKSPAWDRVELADPDKLWDLVESSGSSSPKKFRLKLKLRPDLPLGLFKTLARFRFYQGKTLLLGGLNIPAMVRISGDVEAKPGSLYLGVLNSSRPTLKELTIKSRSGLTPVWIGSEVAEEVRVEPLAPSGDSLVLKCSFPPDLEPELASGFLKVRVKTNREWLLQIPYIGSAP